MANLLDTNTLAHIINFLEEEPCNDPGYMQFISCRVSKQWKIATNMVLPKYKDDLNNVHSYRTNLVSHEHGLELLKFLHKDGDVYREDCMHDAILGDNIEMVDWLHKVAKIPIHTHYSIIALKTDKYNVLRWLSDNGCLFGRDKSVGKCACYSECRHESCTNKPRMMHHAALIDSRNTVKAIRLLCEFGIKPMYGQDMIKCILGNPECIDIIKCLVENNMVTDYQYICAHDNIEIITYLHKICKIKTQDVYNFVLKGKSSSDRKNQANILGWLKSLDTPIPVTACVDAIRNGRPSILQWFIENGVPCDIEKCLDALDHLNTNGCKSRDKNEAIIQIMKILMTAIRHRNKA